MSAEDLGKRLLGEVLEEGLDELLSSLRVLHDPTSSCRLGIPQIDNLLDLFTGNDTIPPQQQTRQSEFPYLFDRPENETNVHPIIPVKAKAPPIIEITSPGSNDGKSQLLYYITAISILPPAIGELHIGGQDAVVVVLDTKSRFSVPRLVQIMQHILSTKLSSNNSDNPNPHTTSKTETASLIQESLKHVSIYHPQSLSSMITTITQLPTRLFHPSNISKQKHLSAILLDSPSSFYWQEKATQETALLPPDTDATPYASKPQNGYAALASAIKKTSTALRAPVIYVTWNLSAPKTQNGQQSGQEIAIRSSLPPPWQGVPSLRLVVARRGVRKFPMHMTGEEAAQLKGRREEAVRRGGFDVRVNWWGCEGWGERVREGVRREGDGFEITVSEQGVVIN